MLKNDSVKYLDEFVKLSDIGNYLLASEELYLSESNLSRHMKTLETEVGSTLFHRSGHRLELTEFGVIFLDYAKRFLALDAEYMQARQDYEQESASVVKVAVARSMNCDHIVNMLQDHFIHRYPQYRISPGEFSRTVSLAQAFQMGYELVFSLDTCDTSSEYACIPWSFDPLVAVLPASHPLAGRSFVHLTELKNDRFILFPEPSFLHRMSLALCKESGFAPHVDFTIHGSSNIGELVSEGVGISLSPSSDVIVLKHYNVSVVPLKPAHPVYLNLYYQKAKPLSRVAKTFLDFAIDVHKNHYEDIPFQGPEGNIANIYFE